MVCALGSIQTWFHVISSNDREKVSPHLTPSSSSKIQSLGPPFPMLKGIFLSWTQYLLACLNHFELRSVCQTLGCRSPGSESVRLLVKSADAPWPWVPRPSEFLEVVPGICRNLHFNKTLQESPRHIKT